MRKAGDMYPGVRGVAGLHSIVCGGYEAAVRHRDGGWGHGGCGGGRSQCGLLMDDSKKKLDEKKIKKKMKTHLVVMAMQTDTTGLQYPLSQLVVLRVSVCVLEETGRQGGKGREGKGECEGKLNKFETQTNEQWCEFSHATRSASEQNSNR
jgi:hypothetical protein